nr:O-antigen ligase family protein [Candidatus Gracilibacteria bacterium]
MLLNLLGIFIVLINKNKDFLEKILKISFISLFIVIIIGIKEYYFPTLDYQITINNAISTFGNNQFLGLYLLLFLPLIKSNFKNKIHYILLFFLYFLLLILTKSFISVSIFIFYFIFLFSGKNRGIGLSFLFLIIGFLTIFFYFPEKLHSFLSRFYIWQNTLSIIGGNIKTILLGNGLETLDLVFSKEKNPYLYIYENYGFIADRSHNIWIDILYSSGVLGLLLSIYILYLTLKEIKNTKYFSVFIIFFIFTFLNFAGIVHYLLLILFLAISLEKKQIKSYNISGINLGFIIALILYLTFCIISCFKFYIAEINHKNGNILKAINDFSYPNYFIENGNYTKGLKYYKIKPDIYYKVLILTDKKNLLNNCYEYIKFYNIAENYIWCGEKLENENYKNESLIFYKNGLSLLPDLWNKNSTYYEDFFIKHTISGNRFYSEKYSKIKEVIEKLEKNNIYVK